MLSSLWALLYVPALLLSITGYSYGQTTALDAEVTKLIAADQNRLADMFKDIHQHPELGFMEVRTAGIVAKELQELGFTVITGIGKTGVAGILKNGSGPTVMYRADMDCNSVRETTGLAYASTKMAKLDDGSEVPLMHACGHDARVTWMLGVAKVMVAMKSKWKGTLVLIGQPAEEPGLGAQAMVSDGMYKRGVPIPDYLFGMHTAPVPVGYILCEGGPRFAGCDQIDVVFRGVGGHGSSPHLAKDPIIMAASAIMQYQAIVSRGIDPQNAAVLTVGAVQAGIDNNVIPSSALVKINLRWFKDEDRKLMVEGIKRINNGIASAYNLPDSLYPTMKMKGSAKPLINDGPTAARLDTAFQAIKARLIRGFPAVMGSEDVHHLVLDNPKHTYVYINVGTANPAVFEAANKQGKRVPFSNHNSDYVVDLTAIPWGVRLGTTAMLELFKK
jgi:hippurate hydrolase